MTREERVEVALHSPVAARFFATAIADGYGSDDLARPATAALIAAESLHWLDPWTGDFRRYTAEALAGVQPWRDVVTGVLSDPRNEWWFAPASPSQLWLREEPFDRALLAPPVGPLGGWEAYAQKTQRAPFTADELPVPDDEPIRSSLHAQAAEQAADWSPEGPLHQASLRIRPDARVYEIGAPGDWHALARRYGSEVARAGQVEEVAGYRPGPTPVWSAVADDWDGGHLSFFGLLTTLYAPVTQDGVTTTLWTWGAAQTLWLRDAVAEVEELPTIPDRKLLRALP